MTREKSVQSASPRNEYAHAHHVPHSVQLVVHSAVNEAVQRANISVHDSDGVDSDSAVSFGATAGAAGKIPAPLPAANTTASPTLRSAAKASGTSSAAASPTLRSATNASGSGSGSATSSAASSAAATQGSEPLDMDIQIIH